MDLAHDLASFVLFFLFICTVVLAVVGVLYFVWRGLLLPALSHLVRKGILQPVVGPARATRERSVSGLSRHFIEIGILSVVLALAALSITKMNTPGMWVTAWFCARANRQGSPYDFCRPLGSIFDVDGDARSGQLEPRPYSNRPNLLRHTLRSSMIDPAYSSERGGQSPGVVPQSKSPGSCDLTRTVSTSSHVPAVQESGADWRAVARLASAEGKRLSTAHSFGNHC